MPSLLPFSCVLYFPRKVNFFSSIFPWRHWLHPLLLVSASHIDLCPLGCIVLCHLLLRRFLPGCLLLITSRIFCPNRPAWLVPVCQIRTFSRSACILHNLVSCNSNRHNICFCVESGFCFLSPYLQPLPSLLILWLSPVLVVVDLFCFVDHFKVPSFIIQSLSLRTVWLKATLRRNLRLVSILLC